MRGRNRLAFGVCLAVNIAIAGLAGIGIAGGSTLTAEGLAVSGTPPCSTLTGAGSTFVFPLMESWVGQFDAGACLPTAGQSQLSVNYASIGSPAGVTQLTDKVDDFAASDAPLTYVQTQILAGPVLTIPATAGALAISYNVAVKNATGATVPLNLTGRVLADIYLGLVTNWNATNITAINPGVNLPNETITVVHRSDGSGTTFVLSSYLSEESPTWKAHEVVSTTVAWPVGVGEKGDLGVAAMVGATPGAIGYVGLTYAVDSVLPVARLSNPSGEFVLPTLASTGAALSAVTQYPDPSGNWSSVSLLNEPGLGAYPLATLSYLLVYKDPGLAFGAGFSLARTEALVSFLWWVTHTGQSLSNGLYFAPLSAAVVQVDETGIGEISYDGGPVPPVNLPYNVTFVEAGLPTGTEWSVNLSGVLHRSTTPSVVVSEPNGSYAFTVAAVGSYSPSPASGSVNVSGAAAEREINFTTRSGSSAGGFLGLSGNDGYYLLVGVAIAVAAGVFILVRRARSSG